MEAVGVLSLADDAAAVANPAVLYVIGIDEVGRGCMAGPVGVAATCYRLPPARGEGLPCVRDSKAMKPADRKAAFAAMLAALGASEAAVRRRVLRRLPQRLCCVLPTGGGGSLVGLAAELVPAAVVDERNILNATLEGMAAVCAALVRGLRAAGLDLTPANTAVLIDGNSLPWTFQPAEKRAALRAKAAKSGSGVAIGRDHACLRGLPCRAVVGGDAELYSIAAASVAAKVLRDAYATTVMDRAFPLYCFAEHKGYVTRLHRERLASHGPCEFHRRSYAPVAEACGAAAAVRPAAGTKRPRSPSPKTALAAGAARPKRK